MAASNKHKYIGKVGTEGYMAPEMHEKKYYNGNEVDIYALMIVLFILKSKTPPFEESTK